MTSRRTAPRSLGAVNFAALLLACLVALAACKSLAPPSAKSMPMSVSKRIIGGYVVKQGDSPFLVSLQRVNVENRTVKHACGASVIYGRFLLTAAHCVDTDVETPEQLKAYLGTLRSGSLKTHDNHSHVEDTEEFQTYASDISQKILDGRKVLFEGSDSDEANAGIHRRSATISKSDGTAEAIMEYEACIEKIIMHENYNNKTKENDIAILVMTTEIPDKFKSDVAPVLLPTKAMQQQGYPEVGTDCTVYGWGRSHAAVTEEEWYRDDFVEPVAKQLDIEVRNDSVCRRFYAYFFQYSTAYNSNYTFCAGSLGQEYGGAFRGDSGGPVICGFAGKYYQAGVVSFGSPFMGAYMPGFFTRVTTYEDWIKKIISAYL